MNINPLAAFLGGLIIGMTVIFVWMRCSTIGTLRIDHTSEEKDVYLFEFTKGLDKLDHRTLVTMKVDHDADLHRLSQE